MKAKTKTILNSTIIIAVAGFIVAALIGARPSGPISNEFLDQMAQRVDTWNAQFPEDRVYVQLDRPFYKPGEDIWFSAYVRNGADFKPSQKSDVLNVELINPKGTVEKSMRIIAKNGKALGDFGLDEFAPGGLYKLKAWTNWQKNEENEFLFERDIVVQSSVLPNLKMKLDFERKAYGAGDKVEAKLELATNENLPLASQEFRFVAQLAGTQIVLDKAKTNENGKALVRFELPEQLFTNDGLLNIMIEYNGLTEAISRSIPIVLNDIKLQLYPEGGDLVEGLESKIGFRAVNENGKPADITGEIIEKESGKKVIEFSSFHNGMGGFGLKPEAGKTYEARILSPKNVNTRVSLPDVIPRGFVLKVEKAGKEQVKLTVQSTEEEEVGIIATVRGKAVWKQAVQLKKGSNPLLVSTEKLPAGIAQFTLFDSKGIERAERLAYVNHGRNLNIQVSTDKEKYLPREKVKMTVKVTDERGMPMPASLSLSVANDQLLSFADDRWGNILTRMMLENDIHEKVFEPAFYFDKKEEKAVEALDYLVMTAGWRRFTWKKVIDGETPPVTFQPERAEVGGVITDANSGSPIQDVSVKLVGSNLETRTDKEGKFYFKYVDLAEGNQILASAKSYGDQQFGLAGYGTDNHFSLYDNRRNNWGWGGKGVEIDEMMVLEAEDGDWDAAPQEKGMIQNRNFPQAKRRPDDQPKPVGINKLMPPAPADVKTKADPKKDAIEVNQQEKQGKKVLAQKELEKFEAGAAIDRRFADEEEFAGLEGPAQPVVPVFYRARQFAAPLYADASAEAPGGALRTDFRSTLFWDGNLEVSRTGKAEVVFFNSDEITSFRTVVEGISEDGMVGRVEKNFFTQLPFALSVRTPVEVATEDILTVPVVLKNNTMHTISGNLNVKAPAGMKLLDQFQPARQIEAGKTLAIFLRYQVLDQPGKDNFEISFSNNGLEDAFSQEITITPKGFPVDLAFSGKELQNTYSVQIDNLVKGSLSAKLSAYPSVISDLLAGIESILREPYGCFEQTSTSSYPNVLVLKYLKEQKDADPDVVARAQELLDKGYKRLTTFETKEKGYEWFGSNPPHEALSAYGLLQFNDMKDVYGDVDQAMIDRTANWLMSRRDGNGGFKRNPQALDNFGAASPEITNAYIVWSLAEAGYKDIKKELDAAEKEAYKSNDPYQLGLVANALYVFGDKTRAEKALTELLKAQKNDGAFAGKTHSVTRSTGQALDIETTSLAIMAMLRATRIDQPKLDQATKWIVGKRSPYGGFGSTQSTILALKALTAYASNSKRTAEDGTLIFLVDGKKVGEKTFKAGDKGEIVLDDLGKFLSAGKNNLKVKFEGCKDALPYTLAVTYYTYLPESSAEVQVKLETNLSASKAKMGETVRLSAKLKNLTAEGLPMTMAIIGLPAGLSAQPWQLKELIEKKIVDFYEVRGNNVACYYRQMKPNEVREINLDLKAEVPGTYDAPASSAYLYYTNEHKYWCALPKVTIDKN